MTLKELLEAYHDEIVEQWVHRLHTDVSERYSSRPVDELFATVSRAADANFAVLTEDDFSKIDALIEAIGRLRLEGDFPLSDIQTAFELYRTVLLPILAREIPPPGVFVAIEKINGCLSYTIKKFSDYFQSLHEKEIKARAENLKYEVEERTRELSESEAKYRVLVEEINDGYFVHQRRVIVFANKAFCDMHGYSPDEVMGKSFFDFVAPESRDELERLYDERMAEREARDQYVYLRLCKDGGRLYTENKVKLITYRDEIATAGVCRDITERMEVEKQRLRLAELEGERKTIALETLHQLMVTLSHYLLNANAIIGGMVRRTKRVESVEGRLASLKAIEEQAKKTEVIIAALKKIADLKTADYSPESHTLMIDVKKEVDEALAKNQGMPEEAGLSVAAGKTGTRRSRHGSAKAKTKR